MEQKSSFAAVVVYYHPDQDALANTERLARCLPVLVIDNSEHPNKPKWRSSNIVYIANGNNLGVAVALNQGIDYWQQHNIQWCFLFDQDSQIDEAFIQSMQKASETLKHQNTAGIVPIYYANNLGNYGALIQLNRWRLKRTLPQNLHKDKLYPVSYAITSGSLINLANYAAIGPHDESLFIDFVDIEWGLRANSLGYQLLTNPNAELQHHLGVEPLSLLGRRIVNHSPLRHYYYCRNLVAMLRKNHVPLIWKTYELFKLPIRLTLYSLFNNNGLNHFTAMTTGLWDGITSKKGKKDESIDHR